MRPNVSKMLCLAMSTVMLMTSVPALDAQAAVGREKYSVGGSSNVSIENMIESAASNVEVQPWEAMKGYAKGDIVSYKGGYYQCTQPHTSLNGWEPDCTPALWEVYTGDIGPQPTEKPDTDEVKVTEVSLDKKSLTLKSGENTTLKATILPENATDKTIKWASSDTSVLTVLNGVITAVAAGKATVTVTVGDKTAACEVVVEEKSAEPMPSDSPLPGRVLTGYWQNFDNGATCLKLADVPEEYNVICVSFADATQTAGEITFQLDKQLSSKLGGYTTDDFKADVTKAHQKGQKVLLAIGGEVGNVIINSEAAAQKFADSAYALMKEYGFDGIDVDLEHGIDVPNLAKALRLLADKAGDDFILTMAPQTMDIYTYDATYLKLAREVKDILTIMNTQYYNSGGMPGYDGANYNQGTIGFLTSLAVTQLESGLRPDQIGLGLPATTKAAGGGYQDPANVATAIESLVYGKEAGGFTPPKAYENLRGAMTWSINWDAANDYKFAKTISSCFKTLPAITTKADKKSNFKLTADETAKEEIKTEPPYPFWKDYMNYPNKDTKVYYKGKIYQNKWYANAGVKPDSGDPWEFVEDAEWTVKEDEKNYQKDENAESNEINKILTEDEINSLYGGINKEYSPEAAMGRLQELIPKEAYEELFPNRFGSEGWKQWPATKQYYKDPSILPDYYSYENLQSALQTLANTIIKVQWYDGAEWCYRLIRLDKTTKEQKLIYSDPSFGAEWLEGKKELCTSICDYGSFLAVGDLNTRKRELAGFLANISHETGGGTIDGAVDESLAGLYFNEEVGFIGSNTIGYVQSTGTSYLPVEGKSYHGRGPIQLSYNYNYGLCSDVLYGDSSILLNNPEKVAEDGVLGFMTGIWFWMTPQPPKPSCHEVITGIWQPKENGANAKYNGNFGLTIIIINNEAGQSENGTGAVARRAKYYRIFADKMGADITGEQCDTVGMTTFVQQPTQTDITIGKNRMPLFLRF